MTVTAIVEHMTVLKGQARSLQFHPGPGGGGSVQPADEAAAALSDSPRRGEREARARLEALGPRHLFHRRWQRPRHSCAKLRSVKHGHQ